MASFLTHLWNRNGGFSHRMIGGNAPGYYWCPARKSSLRKGTVNSQSMTLAISYKNIKPSESMDSGVCTSMFTMAPCPAAKGRTHLHVRCRANGWTKEACTHGGILFSLKQGWHFAMRYIMDEPRKHYATRNKPASEEQTSWESSTWALEESNSQETDSRMAVTRGWESGGR